MLEPGDEQALEDFTRLAALLCGTPVSLLNLVEAEQVVVRAAHGAERGVLPREIVFCAYTVLGRDVMEVRDATQDGRFAENPLVTGPPGFRFYAGAPLLDAGGRALGTLCVLDSQPHALTAAQLDALGALVRQLSAHLELRAQRRALAEAHGHIRALLDATALGMLSADATGTVRTVNRAAERMFGAGVTGLVDRAPLTALLLPEELRRRGGTVAGGGGGGLEALVGRARQGRADTQEWTCVRTDGTHFPARVSVTPVREGGGEGAGGGEGRGAEEGPVTGFLATVEDLGGRREVERMKSEFVSTVSHELRTPLTSIRGSLGLIEGGLMGEVPAPALELVRIARANTERLVRLVNDLLDLDKLEQGQLELGLREVAPAQLLAGARQAVEGMAEAQGVRLELSAPEGLPAVEGDPDRLVQVLTNLLSNAVKFSERGGRVVVRAEVVRWTLAERDALRFSVRDEGPGIPSALLPRLFQRFQQLDASDERAKGGTGLGLAISRALVEQHGGRIGVDSQVGWGSTFFFELPLPGASDVPAAALLEEAQPTPVPLLAGVVVNAPVVLVVSPRREWREAVRRALAEEGYRSRGADGAEQAAAVAAPLTLGGLVLDVHGAREAHGGPGDEALRGLTGLREELRARHPGRVLPTVRVGAPAGTAGLAGVLEVPAEADAGSLAQVLRRVLRRPGPPRVLVVDDDASARTVLVAQLAGAGMECRVAASGEEGLRLLAEERPDVLVLDVVMPVLDGFAVVRALRKGALRRLPLVVYSSRDFAPAERESLTLGPTRHLTRLRRSEAEVLGAVRELLQLTDGAET
jgi:PAS domain S-box-containing protein